jgi:pimeloyl-ACP methyl ester carboxylesterase
MVRHPADQRDAAAVPVRFASPPEEPSRPSLGSSPPAVKTKVQPALRRVRIHGNDIAYRTAGSGPVLLMLHGMVGSSATWRHVMPILSRSFTVVAPDMLGHGESAKPRADYSLGAHASCARDLLVALGHERATVVGQSWGGGVAMQLAYQFPERCERLVLVGSGGLGLEVNALLRALSIPGAALVLPLACRPSLRDAGAWLAAWGARRGVHAGRELSEIWRSYAALAEPDARQAFVLTLRSVVDHQGQRVSARDRLYLTRDVPTLIMWGDKDPVIPLQHALDAHASMPGSRLAIFAGAGHFPHCADPDDFARVLTEFMRDTRPAEPATESKLRDLLVGGRRASA